MRYYSLITGLGGAVIYGSRSKYHPPQNPEICLTYHILSVAVWIFPYFVMHYILCVAIQVDGSISSPRYPSALKIGYGIK
jgi:hypothetical protein